MLARIGEHSIRARFCASIRENPYSSWDNKIPSVGLPKLKFLEVRRAVERDPRPFVWIDDDLDFFQDGPVTAGEWAASVPLPSLLVAPEGETGLLPEQLDAVEDFVSRHGGELENDETGEP